MYAKKTAKVAAKRIISALLSVMLLLSLLVSCSGTGETLMTYKDKTLSVSTYEFLLTRMKGTLASYGYDVSDDDFWNSIISSDGMTYDDYFCTTMLKQACYYLIAEVLFDEEGLALSDEKIDEIDKKMDKLVENAGSKFNLNSELSMCGVNYNMLREIYITEAKVAALKEHWARSAAILPPDLDDEAREYTEQRLLEDFHGPLSVTPREIDDLIESMSRLLAAAIALAVHPDCDESNYDRFIK